MKPQLATIAPDNSFKSILEPFYRLGLVDTVSSTDLALASSPFRNALAGSCPTDIIIVISISSLDCPSQVPPSLTKNNLHAAVKVHPVDTDCRIILDAQIDMFADPKPKVPRFREILLPQFVFLHLQATFEDFFGFGAADGDVHGDFFVAANAECANCVAGLACCTRVREVSVYRREEARGEVGW